MKLKLPLLILILMTLGGCASQQAYQSYADAITRANAYRQQPGIMQEFDAQGRLTKQSIIMPDQPVQVAQIKDSEWASPISMALSLGMFGLGNWAVSHEWSSAMKSVQPNVTTTTTAGGHMAGGDVSIPTTTNTSTSTVTNPTAASATGTK
jgi:uncharacterized lipoprotein YmbA